MAAVSWKSNVSGNWANGGNWSTNAVPGASDDVTISVTAPSTITHSTGTDLAASLYTSSLATLAVSGGVLDIRGNATLNGAVNQTAGTFELGPGSVSSGTFIQSAGTLQVSAGVLRLDGTGNSFAGTLAGAGVNFASGTDTLAVRAAVTLGVMQVSGATVSFGATLLYAGAFTITAGTLALGSNTVTLSGNAALEGGAVAGAGTIATSGSGTVAGFVLTGSTVLSNTGALTETGVLSIGVDAADSAQLVNQLGGTLTLIANSTIEAVEGGKLTNAGTLAKGTGGGSSTIQATTASTGAVTVASGTLTFTGAGGSFAGTIGGAGSIAFNDGSDLLATGIAITVGQVLVGGATVSVGAGLSYGGSWIQSAGTLALGSHTFSLGGAVALDGGSLSGAGTLALSGATEIANTYFLSSAAVSNSGTITQDGFLYDGYYGTDTDTISNLAGATYDIAGSYGIYASVGASFANAGTLVKSAGQGMATINAALTSTGTITVNHGTLTLNGSGNVLQGAVNGPGELDLATGTDLFNKGAVLTVGHLHLAGAAVTLATNITYTKDFALSSGTLALGGFQLKLTTASIEGGVINGSGTVTIAASGLLSGAMLEGSTVLSNSGTVTVSNYAYIGFNGGDTVKLVNNAGGTVSLIASAALFGGGSSTISNAGLLLKASGGGTSTIDASLASTGTITVNSGTLRLSGGSNSLGGTITGAGVLELSAGADTLAAGTNLTVGALWLDGATVTLAGAETVSGRFDQTAGMLALGGQTLALKGAATFEGGAASGSGTITASGTTTAYSLTLEGSTVFSNSGTLLVTNVINCGYFSTDVARLSNEAGGTMKLAGVAYIAAGGASTFSNAGLLSKFGAFTSTISPSLTNTGSIVLNQGTLALSGAANSLSGTISGAGVLELNSGADTIGALRFTAGGLVLDGADLTIGAAFATGAAFSQTAGSLALGGQTVTLSGQANLEGGVSSGSGKLALSGFSEIGDYGLQGSAAMANSGNLTVAADATLTVGVAAADTASLKNFGTGTIDLLGGARIGTGGGGSFVNSGTVLADGAGSKSVAPTTTNAGVIELRQGTLGFEGGVGGLGSFRLDTGTQMTFAGLTVGGTVTMGADTTLGISTTAGFTDVIAGFAAGDLIDLNGFAFGAGAPPTLAFNATSDTLTVSQAGTSFVLQLSGSYAAGDFVAINDHGVIGITHSG